MDMRVEGDKKINLAIDKKLGLALGTLLALRVVNSGLAYLKSREIQRTELEVISSRFLPPKVECRLAEGPESDAKPGAQARPCRYRAVEKGKCANDL